LRKVPYETLISAGYAEEPFPENGMGLNLCALHKTFGFYMEPYKNHLPLECS